MCAERGTVTAGERPWHLHLDRGPSGVYPETPPRGLVKDGR